MLVEIALVLPFLAVAVALVLLVALIMLVALVVLVLLAFKIGLWQPTPGTMFLAPSTTLVVGLE
jgi:hypothetical protein